MSLPAAIYLDYNATTPVAPEVVNEMLPYFLTAYGNPASNDHILGWQAKEAVDRAREELAAHLGVSSKEIIFTAGATEGLNLVLNSFSGPENHIVTVATEHKAVLDTCAALSQNGTRVTLLPVNKQGIIDLDDLEKSLQAKASLVCIMQVNNETGVIQPISRIADLCQKYEMPFLSDTTQAIGKIPVSKPASGIDILVGSAHKFYGPKGVGFVAVGAKYRPQLQSLITGGGQEQGKRAGTLNVAGIAGMARAMQLAAEDMAGEQERIEKLRDRFEDLLKKEIAITVNGSKQNRLYNCSNLCFTGVDSERLLQAIGARVAASRGSACSSVKVEPSHVLKAMGLSDAVAHTAVRFSFGRYTTAAEVDTAARLIIAAVNKLQQSQS